ncbi:MAG: 1-acyl-sn-glycerol-3-phosphate acyltransferase [Bacteroidales bacterium]|nr:1-acyl-sn-glycerol-3-phosphate acyltransferase [Bacteroidales bacterium]
MEQRKILEKTIDVKGVFAAKNPALSKVIPGFVYSYLKRITHEDDINLIFCNNRESTGLEFAHNILKTFGANIHIINPENIPTEGRFITVSNHPLGGLDGIALLDIVGRNRKDVVFPVNDILMFLPNLKDLFIPINKHGSNYDNIMLLNDTFASGKAILYFPAGLVSRKQKGKIKDLEWKKTFLTKAKQFRRDIVPVHIDGRNSDFFYHLANLRKWLKIKANIEMLYLPDEMFRQKNRDIHITFGKRIPITFFDGRFSLLRWAAELRDFVYKLAEDPSLDFTKYDFTNKQ